MNSKQINVLLEGSGAIASSRYYLDAREDIERIAQERDLKVADVPLIINHLPELYLALGTLSLDSMTSEWFGVRDGSRSYEAWHSVGPLATIEGLKEFHKGNRDNFAWVKAAEPRVHFLEAREDGFSLEKGIIYTPVAEDFGTIPNYADMDAVLEAYEQGKPIVFQAGLLSSEQFRIDDRINALCGGSENKNKLHDFLFGNKDEKNLGLQTLNYNGLNNPLPHQALRWPIHFSTHSRGIDGWHNPYQGCFVALSQK